MTASIQNAFARWSRLRAFSSPSGDLSAVTLDIKRWRRRSTTGTAYPHCIMLRIGTDPADALVTVLHELAHLALHRTRSRSWREHNHAWRAVYEAAVFEVTGLIPLPLGRSYEALDNAAAECIRQRVIKRFA